MADAKRTDYGNIPLPALCVKVSDLKQHVDELRRDSYTKAEVDAKLGAIDRATLLAVDLLTKRLDMLEKDVRALLAFQSERTGKSSGSSMIGAYILAILGLLSGAIAIVVEVASR